MHSTPPPTCDSMQRGGGVRVKGPGLEGRILGPGLQEAARLAGGRPATPGGQAGGWADGRALETACCPCTAVQGLTRRPTHLR